MLDDIFTLEEQSYSDFDAEWDTFVAAHPNGSILQTTNWARLKGRFNWQSRRVWLRKEGRLVAGAQILVKSAMMGIARIGYIPHGPLVDWDDEEQLTVLFNHIHKAAHELRTGLVKIEPLVWRKDMPSAAWHALCERHKLRPDVDHIQPPRTVLVDLRPSANEMLAKMKAKTRYNIRLAERKGVIVRQGGSDADFGIFARLMQATAKRDGFAVHDPIYYRTAHEFFAPRGEMALFIAEYEERPLAAIIVSAVGDKAAYLYGASSNEERKRMPTYALQWAGMAWAKERGCVSYDLWGVPDKEVETLEAGFMERHDGLWSVYRNKRGYGGTVQRTVGAADRVYNKRLYALYQWKRGRR